VVAASPSPAIILILFCLARCVCGLQFMVYEMLRVKVLHGLALDESKLHSGHFLAMGACAKVISATSTYPLQVLKSRFYQGPAALVAIQPVGAAGSASVGPATGTSMWAMAQSVWQANGWRGFYKGLSAQLLKTAPSSAITFFAYEQAVRALSKVLADREVALAALPTVTSGTL